MRAVPQCAVDFVGREEALRLDSYQDDAGVWTNGYGHTGADVHAGQRITEDQANAWLAQDLATAARRLAGVVNQAIVDELTDNQHAALLSFVFNLGADKTWTIWKRLNARQFDQVPVELTRFVYVGVAKVQGLVNRRAAEVVLWSTGEPGSLPGSPPSSFTRPEHTPPASSDPTPLRHQPHFLAVGATALLGAPKGIQQVTNAVLPYSQQSHYAAHALEVLASAGAAAAALSVLVLWWQHRGAQS